jgi:[ribosomal protein S5]-alanine N-acetyltransferase
MENFPEIITPRLKLRKVALTDVPLLIEYANNPNVASNVLNMPYPYQPEDAVSWIHSGWQGFKAGEHIIFAITFLQDDQFMGAIGLHPVKRHERAEMGYWLAEPFWGQGIMTEAAQAMLDFGFRQLELHKIFATHFIDNPGSGKVLRNIGMIKEGELKDQYKVKDSFKTVDQYRLTQPEYEAHYSS